MRFFGVWSTAMVCVLVLAIVFPQSVTGDTPTRLGLPMIDVDEDGTAHVLWIEVEDANTSLGYAKVSQDGTVLRQVSAATHPEFQRAFGCVAHGNDSVFVAYERRSPAESINLLKLDGNGNVVFDVQLSSGKGPTWIHRSEAGSLYTEWWNGSLNLSRHQLVKTDDQGVVLDGPKPLSPPANFSTVPVIEDDSGSLAFLYRHGAVDDSGNVYFIENFSLVKVDRYGSEVFRRGDIANFELLGSWGNSVDIGPDGSVGISEDTYGHALRWVAVDPSGDILFDREILSYEDLGTYGEFRDVFFRYDQDGNAHFVWTHVDAEITEPHTGFYEYEYYIYHTSVDSSGSIRFTNLLARTWNLDAPSWDWVVVIGAVALFFVSTATVAWVIGRKRKDGGGPRGA